MKIRVHDRTITTTANGMEYQEAAEPSAWRNISNPHEFAAIYGGTACHPPYCTAGQRNTGVSLRHRMTHVGPITLSEIEFGSDISATCGDQRSGYYVAAVQQGHLEVRREGAAVITTAGEAAIISPYGVADVRWAAGTRALCVHIGSATIDDSLGHALGVELKSHVVFAPTMPTTKGAGRVWMAMLDLLSREVLQRESLLQQAMVAVPFVDSLVRGLLIAAEHPYRDAMGQSFRELLPREVRTAIDIIEGAPQLPLTVRLLAAHANVSARLLQLSFRRALGTTPTAYLREVRLRRAHLALLQCDSSVTTVGSVASDWGFTNTGRFAAMHSARYGETPSATLRRIRPGPVSSPVVYDTSRGRPVTDPEVRSSG